ncbi:restriction endonuclease subunit S [Neisseria cinerea]
MNELQDCILGDLVEFQRGYDLPKDSFVKGEYPVQSSNGILGYHNEYKVKAPGITIGRSGTVGIPHLITKNFFPHNTALYVKDFKGNNVHYIYYLLKNLKLNEYKTGSGVPTMNRNHLHPLKIKAFTDSKHQKSIAAVLSALDKKITLNKQINACLEEMAKTLYDYWFVQFDFPDANGKPYKSSGGEMVFDETLKREIPKGWEVKQISHWIKVDKSGDWGKEQQEGSYRVKVNCVRGADINAINLQGNIETPIRFILAKNEHKLLSPFDFVVEISGGSPTQSTGRLAPISQYVLDRFDLPLICSNFCKAISLKDTSYFYQFAFMWSDIYKNNILFGWEGKTSGIKNLLFDNFVNGYFECFPPKEIAEKFFKIIDKNHQEQQLLLKQKHQLTQLRDFLLPMLMNGQVSVVE